MSLRTETELKLNSLLLQRSAMPTTVQAHDPSGLALTIYLTQIDSLSCAFSELVFFSPQLQSASFPKVESWAKQLSRRVTYLLEQIGVLELDPTSSQILLRSSPPNCPPGGVEYYEMIVSTSPSGAFSLKRFRSVSGVPGRSPAEIQVTYEVLYRLIDDLVSTNPATP
ncbi:hypothetical protein SH668x_002610 [Planctomicrobium sp. SH668]|uniref:hypothetical protein n=1 Tax=Planctomicrobium sp. SH668 TaxID=3448126 RepID=UPI003F5C6EB9